MFITDEFNNYLETYDEFDLVLTYSFITSRYIEYNITFVENW